MIELLKRYRYYIYIFFIPYILVILLFTVKTNYSVVAPGNIKKVDDVIEISNEYYEEGSFNTTYVTTWNEVTLFQRIITSKNEQFDIYTADEEITDENDRKLSIAQKKSSITNSIIASYELANMPISYTFSGIYVTYATNNSSFNYADVILGNSREEIINNLKVGRENPNTSYDILRYEDGNWVPMTITPKLINSIDGNIYGIELYNASYYDYYVINSSTPKFTINSTSTGGPSGGLLQALSIYNKLTAFDLTSGLIISGTGTIDINGNIGAIGSVSQKVYTANYNNVDIFFVPDGVEGSKEHQNYLDALRIKEKIGSKINIVPVKTLNDAITYLINYGKI